MDKESFHILKNQKQLDKPLFLSQLQVIFTERQKRIKLKEAGTDPASFLLKALLHYFQSRADTNKSYLFSNDLAYRFLRRQGPHK